MQLTQRQLFLKHVAQTSPKPLALEIEHAEGVWLTDTNGKRYIDFISGISVCNVGHRHPKVIEAIEAQLKKYMHLMVYGEYILSPQVKLAEKISHHLGGIDSVYFLNSGAEAIDGAIKLARRYTGRKKILSFKNAYHGSSTGALSLMSSEYFTKPFEPLLPEVYHLNPNDYRMVEMIDNETAGIFIEFVRGEAGAELVDHDFIKAIHERCLETGTLFIADEIQTGFGRTGQMFAFTSHSFTPDIIVIAKGMGGGLPIAAFCAKQSIMHSLSDEPVLGHITTFGGNPVCCAASLASLEVLESINISLHVESIESIIRKELIHPLIKNISGKGLLLALEFENYEINQQVLTQCISNGLISDWFLFADNKFRVCPPITITQEETRLACSIIIKSINEIQ